ncbi:hypothetical protein ACJIZ3_019234 [Penstemon smallii]|uniref:Signal peptidase complex-like protein DTM1 n=1 Tax=Penstemon smallii TaxID=265156 RepID=A0ABD3T0L1_9LAMI
MGNDAVLRCCLICLAAIMVVTGLYTQSLKKTAATYLFGMFAICGVLLPDWEFFDRSVSQWCTPVTFYGNAPAQSTPPPAPRFKLYPVRVVVYTTVYGFALHKWWKFVST